jgi:hypothetical protein
MQFMIRVSVSYSIIIIQSKVKFFDFLVLVCQIVNTICCLALKVFIWLVRWSIGAHIKIETGTFNSISNKTWCWYCFNNDIIFPCSWHVFLTRRTTPQMRTQTAFGSKALETVYVEAMKYTVRQSLRKDERAPLPHWIQQKVISCGNKILSDYYLLARSSCMNHHTIDIWYTVENVACKSSNIQRWRAKNSASMSVLVMKQVIHWIALLMNRSDGNQRIILYKQLGIF